MCIVGHPSIHPQYSCSNYFFIILAVLPIYVIPVTGVNQDHLHSVIQFALIMTELWKTFEEAALVLRIAVFVARRFG